MRLVWKDATYGDLHAVMSDLSDISASEFIPDGATWWNSFRTTKTLLMDPAGKAVALVREGGKPLAIFGHHPQGAGARTTWFAMAADFETHGAAATLACRRYLKTLRNMYPKVVFYSFTTSRHPACHRWFEILGFKLQGSTADGSRQYALPMEIEKSDLVGRGG